MSLAAQGRIPVLDIGAYLAGEAGAAAPLARAIARTCEDTGFLVVANHGVPQPLVDDTFAVAQQFFARPEGDKLVGPRTCRSSARRRRRTTGRWRR